MSLIKNISFYIILGAVLNFLSTILKSSFLLTFLCNNLIIILLTLLDINTATTGLLSIKMAELSSKFSEIDFTQTYKEMKLSLKEQIVLIIVSVILLILQGSPIIQFKYKDIFLGTMLTSVFIYALDVLRDTGVSVFDLLDLANKYEKKDKY